MRKAFLLTLFLILSLVRVHADEYLEGKQDTTQVNLLNKPYTQQELARKIRQLLNRRSDGSSD